MPTARNNASSNVRGGREFLVVCACLTCVKTNFSGCTIPRWEAESHAARDAARARQPVANVQAGPSSSGIRVRRRRLSDDASVPQRKKARSGGEDGSQDFAPSELPVDMVNHSPSPICNFQELPMPPAIDDSAQALQAGLYEDPDDLREAQIFFVERDAPPPLAPDSEDSDDDIDAYDTNTYDDVPLHIIDPPPPPSDTLEAAHSLWYIRLLLVVIAFLHTEYHLPFRGCAILLFALRTIFVALSLIPQDDPMPITLTTTFKSLDMEDRFQILVACPKCLHLHASDTTTDRRCAKCEEPLFNKPVPTWLGLLGGQPSPARPPKLSVPYQSLSSMLTELLSRPGMEEQMDAWKVRDRRDGVLNDIMDGAIWKNLPGPDGQKFFPSDMYNELRIGGTLALDWFCAHTSPYAPSHSSGVFSFCVSNLPEAVRYDPKNLLVGMMTPGPTEPTAEQLQEYLVLLVNELIRLYEHGIVICTPKHPDGILVRFALIGIVCDHPAMCKMGGFPDHRHENAPCPKCTTTRADMYSNEALRGEWPRRDGKSHNLHAEEWLQLTNKKERKAYFDKHGARWTEFSRLRYFDVVRMTVIDPMHNLLLGLVKNQWYSNWILQGSLRTTTEAGTKRELAVIHEFLDSLEVPSWLGRLPLRVGDPAGGSLGADEYKMLITTPAAMLLPFIWDRFLPSATQEYEVAKAKFDSDVSAAPINAELVILDAGRANETPADISGSTATLPPAPKAKRKSQKGKEKAVAAEGDVGEVKIKNKKGKGKKAATIPKLPTRRIDPAETRLTLLLAAAIKVLLAFSHTEESLQRGEALLTEYLLLYKQVHGQEKMKPNHHFSTHTGDHIRDYGPVPGFWAFLSERLNKILKSFNLNNWSGGQMEITMMRSIARDVRLKDLIVALSQSNSDTSATVATRLLGLSSNTEVRGTVQDLAHNPGVVEDLLSALPLQPGPPVRKQSESLSVRAQRGLYNMYNTPHQRVWWPTERLKPRLAPFLTTQAQFLRYVILDGRRITSVAESQSQAHPAASSLVKILVDGHAHVGEVRRFFQHAQSSFDFDSTVYAEVAWMLSEVSPLQPNPWNEFPELQVEFWAFGKYMNDDAEQAPASVIPVSSIRCQLARGVIQTPTGDVWVTTTLQRHSRSMGISDNMARIPDNMDAAATSTVP